MINMSVNNECEQRALECISYVTTVWNNDLNDEFKNNIDNIFSDDVTNDIFSLIDSNVSDAVDLISKSLLTASEIFNKTIIDVW